MFKNKSAILIGTFCISVAVAFRLFSPSFLVQMHEDIMYAVDPSASRAFVYGERHFNAHDSDLYDIDRAEYFFKQVEVKNPDTPYLYHELARIEFLRGNFLRALSLIGVQIRMQGDAAPNSFYIRGLIEGYMGDYDAAEKDYRRYLISDPDNWAALNDLAWVLLKAEKPQDALDAVNTGLAYFPNNPWLLNSGAIALYELGQYDDALFMARRASIAANSVTTSVWMTAYPGNDPEIAQQGVDAFQKAVWDNMHKVEAKSSSGEVQ